MDIREKTVEAEVTENVAEATEAAAEAVQVAETATETPARVPRATPDPHDFMKAAYHARKNPDHAPSTPMAGG